MDTHNHERCLPGTRQLEIQRVYEWVAISDDGTRLLLITGPAGFGKSTLANTLSNDLSKVQRRGAFLFFSRDVKDRSTPSTVIKTLAYQLARFDNRIATPILDVLERNPTIVDAFASEQFSELILGPLSSISQELSPEGPIVIILDALDECGTPDAREKLLSVLAAQTKKLPPFVKIIVTCRALQDIELSFRNQSHIKRLDFHPATDESSKDVELFIRSKFDDARSRNAKKFSCLKEEHVIELTKRAAGLFIWANVAVKFILGCHSPKNRLDIVLRGDHSAAMAAPLDQLYRMAIESCGDWADEDFCNDFKPVFGCILTAKDPLTCDAIDRLLDLNSGASEAIVSHFSAILTRDSPGAVRVIHKSCYDYFTDPKRAGEKWGVDIGVHETALARGCIDLPVGDPRSYR